jgi:hypothetical protein
MPKHQVGPNGSVHRAEVVVALQGTIESFAVADVLRLLGSSAKTGRLVLNGDRGTASVWVQAGELVGGGTATRPHHDDLVDVVFELLRFTTGSFIFESDASCPSPLAPLPVGPALEQAEAALGEWQEIVQVVPGLSSWVTLRPELPHSEVVVDQACWTSIVAVGSGCTVGDLATALGLGELPVCRLVRALAAAGFVEVSLQGPEPSETTPLDAISGLPELPLRRPSSDSPSEETGADFGVDSPPLSATEEVGLPSLRISGLVDDPFAPTEAPAAGATLEDQRWQSSEVATDEDPPDLARSMAMLSPKAAEALAATVSAEEPGADDEESRARMLRFLGSV